MHAGDEDRRSDEQEGCEYQRPLHGDFAGCDRTAALLGMCAVGFDVGDVINDVDCAGGKAERGESFQGLDERPEMEELLGKDQRGEDKEVLDPVFGSDESDIRAGLLSESHAE